MIVVLRQHERANGDALEVVRALLEPVDHPRDTAAYLRYFCTTESGDATQLKDNEAKRLALYHNVGSLVRAFANIAGDHLAAGYTAVEFESIRQEVSTLENLRTEIKLASGDYVDLKMYEPAMRHLIDTYIQADESRKLSTFDDMSFVELLVDRGPTAVDTLPEGHVVLRTKTKLELHVPVDFTARQRLAVLDHWYRQQLKSIAAPLLERRAEDVAVEVARWGVRRMKTKWGSCSRTARSILLNLELVKKPPICIEYVVVHELVHLLEPRHSSRFVDLMNHFLPCWRLARDTLNSAPLAHAHWAY